jgi:hypothetical protein
VLKPIMTTASLSAVLSLWSMSAAALPNPALLLPGCGCGDRAEISALQARISEAPHLDGAKELALAPVERAHHALSRARWLAPYSSSIRAAQRRLWVYQADVRRARSEAEVASRFGQLVQLDHSNGVPTHADFAARSCHYSTGETIAIVPGLILGIIPGIILLIILC